MDGGFAYAGMLLALLVTAGVGSAALGGFVSRRVPDSPVGQRLSVAASFAPLAVAGALLVGFLWMDGSGSDYQTFDIDGNVFTGMGGGYFENSWDDTSWAFYGGGISGVADNQPVPAGIGTRVAQYGCAASLPALLLTDDQGSNRPPAFVLLQPRERTLSIVTTPSALNDTARRLSGHDVSWVSRDTFYQTCAAPPANLPASRAAALWGPVFGVLLLFTPLWIGILRLPWEVRQSSD